MSEKRRERDEWKDVCVCRRNLKTLEKREKKKVKKNI